MADQRAKPNIDPPVWEWILAAVGLALVLVAIGSTLYRAMTQESSPPGFETSVESVMPSQNGFVVIFRIRNTGSQSAGAVNVEANLIKAGEKVETGTATLAYVPAHSEREGGLFFKNDPRALELQIRVLGYEKP